MNKALFLDWYADQFDAGSVNRVNYLECASYLEGLRDAMTSELSDEAIRRLIRCADLLRGAANVMEVMRREQVQAPDGHSARIRELEEAIYWALGEDGEFPQEPPPAAGKHRRAFYWRTELRARSKLPVRSVGK